MSTGSPPPPLPPPPSSKSNPIPPPKVEPPIGFLSALQHTGLPPSLLRRSTYKLPSRNWLIFLSLTGSIIGAYVYDRRECRRLREVYIGRVKEEGEGFVWGQQGQVGEGQGRGRDAHLAIPRKLTVYGSKYPGDEDVDQCMRYFRRYVKPILVAAAIDYDMITGNRYGDIARRVEDETRDKRWRREQSKTTSSNSGSNSRPGMPPAYHMLSEEEAEALEINGGTVIIGRATFKEYLSGLVRGYTEPPIPKEKAAEWREERVRKAVEGDGIFDDDDNEGTESTSTRPTPTYGSPLYALPSSTRPAVPSSIPTPSTELSFPTSIPSLPPLLLVPFINYLGPSQIPYMLVDFFYRRRHVRAGGEAALRAVWGSTREFDSGDNASARNNDRVATGSNSSWSKDAGASRNSDAPISDASEFDTSESNDGVGLQLGLAPPPPQGGDLDFDLDSESFYRSYLRIPLAVPSTTSPSLSNTETPDLQSQTPSESTPATPPTPPKGDAPPSIIQRARMKYYAELPARLWVAREFARRGGFGDDSDSDSSESWIPTWISDIFSSSSGSSTSTSVSSEESTSQNTSTIPSEYLPAWTSARSAFLSSSTPKYPPSEVELRMERMEKEVRWRKEEEGWEIVRPERGVVDSSFLFGGALRVFVDARKD